MNFNAIKVQFLYFCLIGSSSGAVVGEDGDGRAKERPQLAHRLCSSD